MSPHDVGVGDLLSEHHECAQARMASAPRLTSFPMSTSAVLQRLHDGAPAEVAAALPSPPGEPNLDVLALGREAQPTPRPNNVIISTLVLSDKHKRRPDHMQQSTDWHREGSTGTSGVLASDCGGR